MEPNMKNALYSPKLVLRRKPSRRAEHFTSTKAIASPIIPQRLAYRSPRTRRAGLDGVLPPKHSTLLAPDATDMLQRVAVVLYQHVLRCERAKAGLPPGSTRTRRATTTNIPSLDLPPLQPVDAVGMPSPAFGAARAAAANIPSLVTPPVHPSMSRENSDLGGVAADTAASSHGHDDHGIIGDAKFPPTPLLPASGAATVGAVSAADIGIARITSAADLSSLDRALLFGAEWNREPVTTMTPTAARPVATAIRTRDGQQIEAAQSRGLGSSTPRLSGMAAPTFGLPSDPPRLRNSLVHTLSPATAALGGTPLTAATRTHTGASKHSEHGATAEDDESHLFHEAQFLRPQFDLSFYRGPVVHLPSFYTIKDIFTFAHYVYSTARLTPECAIVCLIYVERLIAKGNVLLLASNWRPVVLTSLLLACKMWNDLATWNIELAAVARQYTQGSVSRMEQAFVSCLRFQLSIGASEYAQYFFALRGLTEQRDFKRRYKTAMPQDIPISGTPKAAKQVASASAKWEADVYSKSL